MNTSKDTKKSEKQDQLKSSLTSSKGAIFFAYNNEQIDYIKLACLSAASVKKHLNLPCTIITDFGSLNHFEGSDDSSFIKNIMQESSWAITFDTSKKIPNVVNPNGILTKLFNNIIVHEKNESTPNVRNYYDTPYANYKAQFNNLNKHEVFELSPYDQTILFDVDFLVNNAILNLAFDVNSPIQLYRNAQTLKNIEPDHNLDKRLNDVGIPLHWSTIIYFDKSPMSKMFFDMWAHVKENYDYYQSLYKFPEGLYRTDFAVSISMHLLKNFVEYTDDLFAELPGSPMKYMAYKDDIASVDKNGIVFFANNYKEEWNNILTYSEGENLHMMNKRAVDRHYDKLMELYV